MEQKASTSSKKNQILIAIIVALLVAMGIAAYFIFNQKSQLEEMQQVNEISKQQLEDEYASIDTQYEGFKISIKNDSLLQQLSNEQAKVQRLREELRTVKATDKAEISRLTNELASLRKILKSYIAQIDSLNRANEKLTKEKEEITNKKQDSTRTMQQISQE